MKLKKLVAVTIMAAMVFTLAACQSRTQTKESESTTTQETTDTASDNAAESNSLTIKDGVLQVGMEIG